MVSERVKRLVAKRKRESVLERLSGKLGRRIGETLAEYRYRTQDTREGLRILGKGVKKGYKATKKGVNSTRKGFNKYFKTHDIPFETAVKNDLSGKNKLTIGYSNPFAVQYEDTSTRVQKNKAKKIITRSHVVKTVKDKKQLNRISFRKK